MGLAMLKILKTSIDPEDVLNEIALWPKKSTISCYNKIITC